MVKDFYFLFESLAIQPRLATNLWSFGFCFSWELVRQASIGNSLVLLDINQDDPPLYTKSQSLKKGVCV